MRPSATSAGRTDSSPSIFDSLSIFLAIPFLFALVAARPAGAGAAASSDAGPVTATMSAVGAWSSSEPAGWASLPAVVRLLNPRRSADPRHWILALAALAVQWRSPSRCSAG